MSNPTNPGSPNNPPRPSRPRNASSGSTSLAQRYATEQAALKVRIDRLATVSRKNKERFERMIARLAANQTEDHATIAELTQHFTELAEQVGNGRSLDMAARVVGFPDEAIRLILNLKEEDNTEDNVTFVTGIVDTLGSIQARLETLTDGLMVANGTISTHTTQLDAHEERITHVTGRLTNLEHAHAEIQSGSTFPNWGFGVALVAWLIVSVLWTSHTWKQTAPAKIGKVTGNLVLHYRFMNSGWTALLVGFAAALLVLLIVSLIPSKHYQRGSRSSSSSSFRRSRNLRNRRVATTPPVEPTQVLTPANQTPSTGQSVSAAANQ
jgi:hypothetical protein